MQLIDYRKSVHPHARGERRQVAPRVVVELGSSPRPWGTPHDPAGTMPACRFIPTPVGNASTASISSMRMSVHPHARGERIEEFEALETGDGSSPRPWGTRPIASEPAEGGRFIPTPVGNARTIAREGYARAVHPHARGERRGKSDAIASFHGSSPRPWGTQQKQKQKHIYRRFIPTPVGNANRQPGGGARGSVHPHARGERSTTPRSSAVCVGSSPRPWGTRLGDFHHIQQRRFIPTPVGNAVRWRWPRLATPVHPHARGERCRCRGLRNPRIGSSPRPWGTPARWGCVELGRRFIPTPVGNAPLRSPTKHPRTVHPHARGERGLGARSCGRATRFIPTPVGNAARSEKCLPFCSVHPHARGERAYQVDKQSSKGGSSPRPWGTRHAAVKNQVLARFIPTPVGNARTPASSTGCHAVHPHARGERSRQPGHKHRRAGSSPRPWGTRRRLTWSGCCRSVHPHARGERLFVGSHDCNAPGSSPRPWGTPRMQSAPSGAYRFIPTPVGNAARISNCFA